MTSYISISQDLTPKVTKHLGNVHYCFTIAQSREIAKLLELGKHNDSLVYLLSKNNDQLQLVAQKKDSLMSFKDTKIKHYATLFNNQEQSIQLLEQSLKRKDKKIKRSKFHKVLMGVGAVILGTLVISK